MLLFYKWQKSISRNRFEKLRTLFFYWDKINVKKKGRWIIRSKYSELLHWIYSTKCCKTFTLFVIKWMDNNSDDYDEIYVKIKFNSDDDLPLGKSLEMENVVIVS